MKQLYFTPRTIREKSGELLNRARLARPRQKLNFVPQRSALLVLDMQRYFLEADSHAYVPSAPAIVAGIKDLAAQYSRSGLPIIFTRHINTGQNAAMMGRWWRELITADNPLSAITAGLDTSAGTLLSKTQYDAFYRTGLADLLRSKSVTQVVICGLMTHLCCETTARSAFVHGFEVFFTVDGTATYNIDFHRATLTNLTHGFAEPVLVAEILAQLQSGNVN
jgi:isochorismate hydrolase